MALQKDRTKKLWEEWQSLPEDEKEMFIEAHMCQALEFSIKVEDKKDFKTLILYFMREEREIN